MARWRRITAVGLVVGALVVWVVTWTALLLAPPIEPLVDTTVTQTVSRQTVSLAAGTYTLYFDAENCGSAFDGGCPMHVTIEPSNGEPALDLRPTGSTHDTIFGVGVATFRVEQPGEHTIDALGSMSTVTLARGPLFDPGAGELVMLGQIGPPALVLVALFMMNVLLGFYGHGRPPEDREPRPDPGQ